MDIRLNILFISLLIGFAYPCSCLEPPPPEEAYEDADVVFSGQVTNIVVDGSGYYYEVTFQTIDVWKGEIFDEIIILTETSSDACGYNFQINNEYLIYAYSYNSGIYTNICTRTNLLEYADEDLDYLNQLSICDNGYIEIDGYCFYEDDIAVLQTLIDNSYASGIDLGCADYPSPYCGSPNPQMDSPTDSWFWNVIDGQSYYFADGDGIVEPLELGLQEWNDSRLTSLMCGAYIYCSLSGEIPENISDLTEIEVLRLEVNYFDGEIPESVCELENVNFNDNLSFDFSYNQLCPPYPDCVPESAVNYMDTSECEGCCYEEFLANENCDGGGCFIPQCTENCEWEPMQCWGSTGYCWCVDENGIEIEGTSQPPSEGFPDCEEIDLGDINGDDSVDILDIVMLVNYILSGDTSELDGADINNDGEVNILDVVQLVNIILGVTENTVTDIDGNVYETVQIGGQLWMAENLKVTHYQNSDEIPYIYNDPQYGAYINYSNNADNVGVYGRLYNWFAVNDERGLCPDNWHVPSDDEFKSLEMYLGMSESEANGEGLRGTDEGGKLKEEGNEHWNSPNTGATNETGFTALPSGNRRYETYTNQEIFSGLNRYGFFWSSSEVYTVNAWYRVLSYDYSESNRYHLSKANAFSVRCVED